MENKPDEITPAKAVVNEETLVVTIEMLKTAQDKLMSAATDIIEAAKIVSAAGNIRDKEATTD